MRYKYIGYKYTRRIIADTAFQGLWESFGSWPAHSTTAWRPPTDIYETRDSIIVVIELAGLTEDDMTITLFSDLLVVEGRRAQRVTEMNACHQLGIKYGDFRSEILVPIPVDHNTLRADYTNGLLTVMLRKQY